MGTASQFARISRILAVSSHHCRGRPPPRHIGETPYYYSYYAPPTLALFKLTLLLILAYEGDEAAAAAAAAAAPPVATYICLPLLPASQARLPPSGSSSSLPPSTHSTSPAYSLGVATARYNCRSTPLEDDLAAHLWPACIGISKD